MAEYKGKLLKGLFTQAKSVILGNGNTVESAVSGLTANKIESFTSIITYTTEAEPFTIPSDGYVNLNNTSSQVAKLVLKGSSGNVRINVGLSGGSFAAFVRKGMKVYVDGTTSSAYFIPLS